MPEQRRNPFEGVTDFVTELGRLRTLGVHGTDLGSETTERTHASAWVPPTDILARGDDLVIRVELAGVAPDDVELAFRSGVLTVSGVRPTSDDGADFYVRERFHGAFRRAITLPEGTEAQHVEAEFELGLVEVTVRGAARARQSTRIGITDRSGAATRRSLDAG